MRKRLPARRYDRVFVALLFLVAIPCGFFLLTYYILSSFWLPRQRVTMMFLTNPVEVVSFDPNKNQWSIVTFPSQTHISGMWGLGQYSVESLWRLASLEGSASAVVLGSVGDEVGAPIDYFVGRKDAFWQRQKRNFLSIGGVLERFMNRLETNMPVFVHIALARSFSSADDLKIERRVLGIGKGLIERPLPDDSTILSFNREQFDRMTTAIFEDKAIREERIRVAIFNTTGRPLLGNRVARIIDRLGAIVVFVGNESSPVDECVMSGNAHALKTKTASMIQSLFECVAQISDAEERADLSVRVGKRYEQRFIPPVLHTK